MAEKRINLVAVDMGYGHQRAAYPLLDIAGGEILTLNKYPGISASEESYWRNTESSYDLLSRLKRVPLLGDAIFGVMDYFQRIKPFYPYRDLSSPSFQQRLFYRAVRSGLGRNLVLKLNESGLPFVTTFFVAAYAAEYHGYAGDIFCIVCDTDASRAWAPLEPAKSRIKYLLPSEHVRERFLMYGVRPENLIVTGFPLPDENIGEGREIARKDLASRLLILDDSGKLKETYPDLEAANRNYPLTLAFAVGGAGAQKEMGRDIMSSLSSSILSGTIRLRLIAGSRPEVKEYFEAAARELKLGGKVEIIFSKDKIEYFRLFNEALHTTDILWTKPSELSFYCALGLPMIIAAPVGSQEEFNREWLMNIGAGIDAISPEHVSQWLPDLIASGRLAKAALDAYRNADSQGTDNIRSLFNKI